MKETPVIIFLLFISTLLLTGSNQTAEKINFNATVTRIVPVLNISLDKPVSNVSLTEGEEFILMGSVTCSVAPCGDVQLFPQYCTGYNCTPRDKISGSASGDLYMRLGDLPKECLNMPEKISRKTDREVIGRDYPSICSANWTIRVKHVGVYRINLASYSNKVAEVDSKIRNVSVRGCGDGICGPNESYTSCPGDCCLRDCTGNDGVCHSFCNGFNNCIFSPGCDAKPGNSSFCVSPHSFIKCCKNNVTSCSLGEYCLDASCRNCSRICDGKCSSPACYSTDPDCDIDGNALVGCCGNGILEKGEECEPGRSDGKCPETCTSKCVCPVPTTTSTTKPVRETMPEVTVTEMPEPTTVFETVSFPETSSTIEETSTGVWEETTSTTAVENKSSGGGPSKDQISGYLVYLIPVLLVLAVVAGSGLFIYRKKSREKTSLR